MTTRWADAVAIAKQVRAGRVESYALAALKLANYILDEQEQIDLAMAEAKCPFPEEPATSPEVPIAKHNTLPYPIQDEEDREDAAFDDTTLVDFKDIVSAADAEMGKCIPSQSDMDGPKTGVLNAPQTGVRPREVLPTRHNSPDGKKR